MNKSFYSALAGLWIGLLLTLPWLNPFSSGPTPNFWPWLFSAVCAVFLWLGSAGLSADRLAWAWLLAAVLSTLIGLLQYFGGSGAFHPWLNTGSLGEAFGNLRQRNQFASLTAIGLAGLFYLALARSWASLPRAGLCALAALLAVGNAASSSRTGLLQLFVLCALCGIWGRWADLPLKTLRPLLLSAALAYCCAVLALPWLAGFDWQTHGMTARLQWDSDAQSIGCNSRLTLWSNVLHLIAQKPWTGWGWGNLDYAHFITLYPGPRFCEILDNAHNLPLHLAVELGLPIALLVCLGAGWLVWRAQPWRETRPERQMAWAVLAVIMLHSLLEYPLWYGPFQIAAGLCVLLLGGALRCAAPPNSAKKLTPAYIAKGLTAIVLIVMVVLASMDYHRVSQIYLAPEARSPAYRDDTLAQARKTWFFKAQADFAVLSITPLTAINAQNLHDLAESLLHYSPEPMVIEKLIESATLLGRDDEAVFYLARYRAAFPADHKRWAKPLRRVKTKEIQIGA